MGRYEAKIGTRSRVGRGVTTQRAGISGQSVIESLVALEDAARIHRKETK